MAKVNLTAPNDNQQGSEMADLAQSAPVSKRTDLRDCRPKLSKESQASRVASVSIVLTRIQPSDSSTVLSLGVAATQRTAKGIAHIGSGLVRMRYVVASVLPRRTSGQVHTCRDEASDCACYSNDNLDNSIRSSTPTLVHSHAQKRGEIKAQHILAFGNTFRHFVLEFTLGDGTVHTMEKLFRGVVFYPGTSSRKKHVRVWSIPLEDKTTSNGEDMFLPDLQNICEEENKCPYSFFRSNCKHMAWSVLTKTVPTQTLRQFERRLCSHERKTEKSSYCIFRDTCQLIDMELRGDAKNGAHQ